MNRWVTNVYPLVGNVNRLVENVYPLVRNVNKWAGNVYQFVRNVNRCVGNVYPFVRNVNRCIGNVYPFIRNVSIRVKTGERGIYEGILLIRLVRCRKRVLTEVPPNSLGHPRPQSSHVQICQHPKRRD